MILNETQIKDIVKSGILEDIDQLNLIETYIKEKKRVDTGTIIRPTDLIGIQLMNIAFNTAVNYYSDKYDRCYGKVSQD